MKLAPEVEAQLRKLRELNDRQALALLLKAIRETRPGAGPDSRAVNAPLTALSGCTA